MYLRQQCTFFIISILYILQLYSLTTGHFMITVQVEEIIWCQHIHFYLYILLCIVVLPWLACPSRPQTEKNDSSEERRNPCVLLVIVRVRGQCVCSGAPIVCFQDIEANPGVVLQAIAVRRDGEIYRGLKVPIWITELGHIHPVEAAPMHTLLHVVGDRPL